MCYAPQLGANGVLMQRVPHCVEHLEFVTVQRLGNADDTLFLCQGGGIPGVEACGYGYGRLWVI